MKARLARFLLRWACRLDPGATKALTDPLDREIHALHVDRDRYRAAHDRITNELAHYIATAYSR